MALSGGPDSMALLHLLLHVAPGRELSLVAAHFDHGLRPGSAAEAERVERWATRLGVPCRIGRPKSALAPRQEAFREARYRFLGRVADREGAARIATGHQADDQAETVLFRILRGTGLRGLAGIPARRGPIVRPLLPFHAAELEAWLANRGIEFLRDPSNRDPRWARARLRTRVLPEFERRWGPGFPDKLRSLARSARRVDRALEARARETLERSRAPGAPDVGWSGSVALDLGRLRRLDSETLARVVRRAAREAGVSLTRGGTRAAVEFISAGRSGGSVDVGGGLVVAREFGVLRVGWPPVHGPDGSLEIQSARPGRGEVLLDGRRVQVAWGGDLPAPGEHGRPVELALERLRFPLIVRGWQEGDRIRTWAGSRKLKKLFGERRVPRSARRSVPVVATPDGRVLAVGRLAVDPAVAPDAQEERLMVRIGQDD